MIAALNGCGLLLPLVLAAIPQPRKIGDRVGDVVSGKYKLKRLIGTGSAGAVYEAVHSITSKHVALKLMGPDAAESEENIARFLREARAAAAIGHPALVDVLDAGQEPDGSVYLALELLEGEDMASAVRRGDLSVAETVKISLQILEGLAAAHARGLVHRDIKPENVFLTRNDRGELRVRLLDFGIAKQMHADDLLFTTKKGTVLGTPYYMSPEQMSAGEVDIRSDLWSTGALMFHALAGRPPFEAENYNMMVVKILASAPPRLREVKPGLPEWLARVVDRALVHDVMERWQTAEQMIGMLRNEGQGGTAAWDDEVEEQTTRMDVSALEGVLGDHGKAAALPPAIAQPTTQREAKAPAPSPASRVSVHPPLGASGRRTSAPALSVDPPELAAALRAPLPLEESPSDSNREMRVFVLGALTGGALITVIAFALLLFLR